MGTGHTVMAKDPNESPAVQSLKQERARQRGGDGKGELERRLEDTFPASDPVSMTHTGTASGRTDLTEAERVKNDNDLSAKAGDDVTSFANNVRAFISSRPVEAAAIVAALGYLLGRTR